jgi:hypothetical protein
MVLSEPRPFPPLTAKNRKQSPLELNLSCRFLPGEEMIAIPPMTGKSQNQFGLSSIFMFCMMVFPGTASAFPANLPTGRAKALLSSVAVDAYRDIA